MRPQLSAQQEHDAALALLKQHAQAAADPAAAKAVLADTPICSATPTKRRCFVPRRHQCSSDPRASRERRRKFGGDGRLPPAIRQQFTEGQRAVLSIIDGEVRKTGQCCLCLDALAARAGGCRTTAQNALREAQRLGLIHVQLRPVKRQKNLTNLITIISADWLERLRNARGIGFKNMLRPVVVDRILSPTKNKIYNPASFHRVEPPHRRTQGRP